MAPKARLSVEDAVKTIIDFKEFFCNNKLPSYNSEVWLKMSRASKEAWIPHTWYTNVTENRRSILSKALETIGIDSFNMIKRKRSISGSENEMEVSKTSDIASTMSFDIIISREEWSKIEPSKNAPDRLKAYSWGDLIAKAIWNKHKLPCAFSFKRADVKNRTDVSYLIEINGCCKSEKCKNYVSIVGYGPPQDDGLVLNITCHDTSKNHSHELCKRPLNGIARIEAGNGVKGCSAENYRRKISNKNMEIDAPEPPFLHKARVYRRIKKECIDKELGIDLCCGLNVRQTLQKMTLIEPFKTAIKVLNFKPFFCMYISKENIRAYKEYHRITEHPKISIDATGTVVKKIENPDKTKSGHIFLYAVVVNIGGTTLGIYHMLSERHTTTVIKYWLDEWSNTGIPLPIEAVSDYSRTLLSAMCLTFNGQTIKEYVDHCFLWSKTILNQPQQTRCVNTYIRVDVAHFVHLVTSWECFKHRQPGLKKFYVRCVALLVDCTNVEEFEKVFLLICISCLHDHEDTVILKPWHQTVKSARDILEGLISFRQTSVDQFELAGDSYEPKSEGKHSNSAKSINKKLTQTQKWIQTLIKMATQVQTPGIKLNSFYMPKFIEKLEKFAGEFPLWTNVVIQNHIEHATSSYIESYFNYTKNIMLQQYRRPLTIYKFLKIHLEDINGQCKSMVVNMINCNTETQKTSSYKKLNIFCMLDSYDKKIDNSYSQLSQQESSREIKSELDESIFDDSDLFSVENWKGLALADDNLRKRISSSTPQTQKILNGKKDSRTSLYFKDYPEIRHINDTVNL